MESVDKNEEHLEMAAAKPGNYTHVVNDIDWLISHIDCLCQWQLVNSFPIILNCRHGIVACQVGLTVKQWSLTLVEVCASTCAVNNDGGKLL